MTEGAEVSRPHEYYIELARNLPQVSVNDLRVQMKVAARKRGENLIPENWGPFGNGFYILFEGLRMDRSSLRYKESLQRFRVEKAEDLGESWQRFLTENESLLKEFDEAFEESVPYQELETYFFHLVNNRQAQKITELDDATHHPLGVGALQQAYWERMNPLLKRAAQGMQDAGIDPQQFYG